MTFKCPCRQLCSRWLAGAAVCASFPAVARAQAFHADAQFVPTLPDEVVGVRTSAREEIRGAVLTGSLRVLSGELTLGRDGHLSVTDVLGRVTDGVLHPTDDLDEGVERWIGVSFGASLGADPGMTRGTNAAPTRQRAAAQMLTLRTGERLAGHVRATESDDASIVWSHTVLGEMRIGIDDVRTIALKSVVRVDAPAVDVDMVLLDNGDWLTGFVVEIGEQVSIETDAGTVNVPISGVARVELADVGDDPAQSHTSLARVRLIDSTEILCEMQHLGPDGARVVPAITGRPKLLTLPTIEQILWVDGSLRTLGTSDVTDVQALGGRLWTQQPTIEPMHRFGTFAIDLPGPLRADVRLRGDDNSVPPDVHSVGPAMLVGTAQLREQCRAWGNCTLEVRAKQNGSWVSVWSGRLTGNDPVAFVRAEVPAGTSELRFELGEGDYGSIQDHVVLTDALLFARSSNQ